MPDRFPGYDVLSKRRSPSWNDATRQVMLHDNEDCAVLWDFQREPFIVAREREHTQ